MTEDMTPGEMGRALERVEQSLDKIEQKLDRFTQEGVIVRLQAVEGEQVEIKERLTWYGRYLLGVVAMLVAGGLVTILQVATR